jgi:prevent-host-death family protein
MNMPTQQIGVFEAKTHFSKILERVKKGENITITQRGKPVAKISPIEEEPEMTYMEAVEAMIEMRKLFRGDPKTFNLKEAIEEGRRY